MLSDRPYMRHDYERERTSVLTWLLCAIGGGWVLQVALGSEWLGGAHVLQNQFGLSIHGLRQGWIWTLFTHAFLTESAYVFHVVGSALLLYFVGRELLPSMGPKRFVGLFFGATIAGGLAWTLVHWSLGGTHVGAMAAVDALLVLFACLYPNRQVDFLLFFVLPVRVRTTHLVLFLLGIDTIGLVAYEIMGAARPFEQFALSHSAHLGGMAAGWLYFRFTYRPTWRLGQSRKSDLSNEWGESAKEDAGAPQATAKPTRDLRAEVDRVLDKINSHGFASLTAQERRVLDEAKDSITRR
jgi:membrane associated rhomboid family serine protease